MKKILVLFSIFLLGSCAIGVTTINKSKKIDLTSEETDLEKYANKYFWDNFHQANYQNLDSIFFYLTSAYLENPNHLETVAHLGFAHAWAVSENAKLTQPSPMVIDHINLAVKYFGEAYRLNPNDARILGFLADFKIAIGSISDDKSLSRTGYFEGLKSIRRWPEFNYFTVGYTMSRLPHDNKLFKKGLEWQWKTLDKCFCEKFDRKNPNIKQYISLSESEQDLKKKRACWNSWIAPHNVEGFYLNLGDMLVKSGDWEKGIEVYNLIKDVPEYDDWTFKDFLKRRIENAQNNVQKFRTPIVRGSKLNDDEVMLVSTSISCMSCHKMNSKEMDRYKDLDWNKYKIDNNVYSLLHY